MSKSHKRYKVDPELNKELNNFNKECKDYNLQIESFTKELMQIYNKLFSLYKRVMGTIPAQNRPTGPGMEPTEGITPKKLD